MAGRQASTGSHALARGAVGGGGGWLPTRHRRRHRRRRHELPTPCASARPCLPPPTPLRRRGCPPHAVLRRRGCSHPARRAAAPRLSLSAPLTLCTRSHPSPAPRVGPSAPPDAAGQRASRWRTLRCSPRPPPPPRQARPPAPPARVCRRWLGAWWRSLPPSFPPRQRARARASPPVAFTPPPPPSPSVTPLCQLPPCLYPPSHHGCCRRSGGHLS